MFRSHFGSSPFGFKASSSGCCNINTMEPQGRGATSNHSVFRWAIPLRLLLSASSVPLRLISPCCGINGPAHALIAFALECISVGDYDHNIALYHILKRISSASFCGSTLGDITTVAFEHLNCSAHALISGPPCPPFSTIGLTLGSSDTRCNIFITVLHWIIYLATHGNLKFFILENVSGILKRFRGQAPFADWVIAQLKEYLPPGWEVIVVKLNALRCGLCQFRERVFFIGTCAAMRATRFQKRILSQPLVELPLVDITEIVESIPNPTDWEFASVKQKVNVMSQLETFQAMRLADPTLSEIAVTDCCRDPNGCVDKRISIGHFRTLRTNSADVWLLPGTPQWEEVLGKYGRRATRAEKALASGFCHEWFSELSSLEFDRVMGNTIPVQMAGIVLLPLLRAWGHMEHALPDA